MKIKRLFITLGIFLSIFFGGCSSNTEIDSEYIRFYPDKDVVDKKPALINSRIELDEFLEVSNALEFEKFDDNYFTNNSLIIFIDFESSSSNISKIVSYSIQGNEIKLNIETKSYGQILDVAYYYFVLKMPKNITSDISTITINKNGKIE